jgi:hypothetical protein
MDEAYFRNYCGYGPYDEHYLFHSGIEHCLSIFRRLDIEMRSVVVLGAATGRVLEHFERAWSVRPWGCEISEWAHARIPARYRRRIRRADMREYVPALAARRRSFDLLFTNSLVYVHAPELPALVDSCARVAGYMHFYSSTREAYERGDRYRVTLRPAAWWRALFEHHGFAATRSPYVWRSLQRGAFPPREPPA